MSYEISSRRRYSFAIHGQPRYGYQRRRSKQRRKLFRWTGIEQRPLAMIIDPENLLRAFDELASTGGQATGPDRLSFSDLSRREAGEVMRAVSHAITEGQYRPPQPRIVMVPKRSGGRRQLAIANITHRVITKATAHAIEHLVDRSLLDCVHGFRPRRSFWTLLAAMEQSAIADSRMWISAVDVENAFPNTPIDRALASLERSIPNAELMAFVSMLIRGHDPEGRQRGLAQGCPLSVLAFNSALRTILDEPFALANTACKYFRYADNVVIISSMAADGCRAVDLVSQLIQAAGMRLKPHDEPQDLCLPDTELEMFGIRVSHRNQGLRLAVGEDAWEELDRDLADSWEAANPPKVAQSIAMGWATSYGAAIENVELSETVSRIHDALARCHILEGASIDEFTCCIHQAQTRWQALRTASRSHMANRTARDA